jgi:hypothetical protein
MRAIDLKSSFPQRIATIKNDISILSNAMVFVTECNGLQRLMGLVLQLSNFLNHGSYRSGAFGFKISSLKKLTSMRSNNPNVAKTLLHVIAKMANNDPLLADVENLIKLRPATFVHSASITENLHLIKHDIKALTEEKILCSEELESEEVSMEDKKVSAAFVDASTKLLTQSSSSLMEIQELQKQLQDHESRLATFLCEDVETFKQDIVISELHDFAKSFSKIRAEEKRMAAAKERRKAIEVERAKKNCDTAENGDMGKGRSTGGGGGDNNHDGGAGGEAPPGGSVSKLLDGMMQGKFKGRRNDGRKSIAHRRFASLSSMTQGVGDGASSSDDDGWESD